MKVKALFCVVVMLASSCATYYELNYEFNKSFEAGDIVNAEKVLASNPKVEKSKTRFLYYANRGVVTHLLGKYEESNEWLEKAYIFGEDYQKNYLNFAGSYFLNPNLIVYPGEDHEHLMLLYYKALNYLKLRDYDAALVECRRLNNRLYALADKYSADRRFQRDAFIHNLMGIVYDASGDANNAFIAYRNALEIYKKDYQSLFSLRAPNQLKKDLLRTAYLAGFWDELEEYEQQFGMKYSPVTSEGGNLVFFWHNGLSPVKDEWSITFVAVQGDGGRVFFENDEMGLSFPFYYDTYEEGNASIEDLSGFRVAFPKYVERRPQFSQGRINAEGVTYPLEEAEDINAIAFKVLNDRMLEELAKGLLRVALKKAAERQARKENEALGFIVGALNMATEKADTRNWQTLPHSIHYTRIPLQEGLNTLEIQTEGINAEGSQIFRFKGRRGATQFQTYQTLESQVPF